MASWNDLPKELKLIIFRHLLDECYLQPYVYGSDKKNLVDHHFIKQIYTSLQNAIILPSRLYMYELLILLSQIDKNRYSSPDQVLLTRI